jgi:integrase
LRLYRRGDTWWADFWHQGRRIRRSSGTTDQTAAEEWRDTLKAGLWREAKLGERRAATWDEAVLEFLAEKKDKASLSTDKDRLRWLTQHLRGKRLEAIDTRALTVLARQLTKDGKANATVNRYMAAASGVLHHARALGWLQAVPKIPHLDEPRKRIRFLKDQDEAERLFAELPQHVATMSRFALATGLRRHNVTHLEWEQVDLRRKIVWYHPDEMKAGKSLSCPLNAEAVGVLKAQQGKDARWVFPYRGGPVHDVTTRAWHEACARAKVHDFTFHDFRHTWASWHVQNGTPLPVLKELGGWQTLAMVEKYAHLAPSHIARWADNVTGHKTGTRKKRTTKKVA